MAAQGSPAVARHRLRLALRRRREATGRTQGDIAKSLDWSLSKLQRIEAGENAISTTDLQALLGQLKVTDPALISTLLAEAKVARGRSRWDDVRYRDNLTPATKALLDFEAEAAVIRSFQVMVIPGVLQTRDVAETMLRTWTGELTDAERETRLEARLRRRKFVFDRTPPPDYRLILDESVLHRDVGGPHVYADQLRHLLTDARERRIDLRVAPFSLTGSFASNVSFTVLTMGMTDNEDSVLYRENNHVDEIVQTLEKVLRYLHSFDQMWQQCFSKDETQGLVETRISHLHSYIDRKRTTETDR